MNEETFKNNFISTFLATWTANNYVQYCIESRQGDLEKPPVEDAIYLANTAWLEYQKHI